MWRFTLLLLFLAHRCLTDDSSKKEKCEAIKDMMEYKLINDIRVCNSKLYTPPPTNGTGRLKVMVSFFLKKFSFDSELQEFSVSMLTILQWDDERFKWDPSKYEGIKRVEASTMDIWAPAIKLINGIREEDEWKQKYVDIPCDLSSEGSVTCMGFMLFNAKCSTDLNDWPYDAQNCKLEFGPFHEVATKIQLMSRTRAVSMIAAEYGSEWDITNYTQSVHNNSESQLVMKFRLERHGDVLAAIVIYPSLILTALTLPALFIDARLNLRLLVMSFSLLGHWYFLTDLTWEIPKSSEEPPRLLMYYRGSFILTSIHIAVSFVMKLICKKKEVCPNWVNSIDDFVFMNKLLKFAVWPRWETKDNEIISDTNFSKDWTDLANIINSVCIIVSVIVYISLYCAFMPHPIPWS